jgi:hypothetical protein
MQSLLIVISKIKKAATLSIATFVTKQISCHSAKYADIGECKRVSAKPLNSEPVKEKFVSREHSFAVLTFNNTRFYGHETFRAAERGHQLQTLSRHIG